VELEVAEGQGTDRVEHRGFHVPVDRVVGVTEALGIRRSRAEQIGLHVRHLATSWRGGGGASTR
jgi:hypothetical protein